MGKLDELKKIVADAFENASDKTAIDKIAQINNALAGVEKEFNDVTAKNVELIKSYKDLIQHTSFNDPATRPTDEIGAPAVDFDALLNKFSIKE